jgi:hypothetical protein
MNRQEGEGNEDKRDFPSSALNPLFEFSTEMETPAYVDDVRLRLGGVDGLKTKAEDELIK